MGDYNIITCCDTGDGGGGGGGLDCPLTLIVKDEGRTYTTTTGGQFYWDIQTSTPTGGWASYNAITGNLSILQKGTYQMDLTLNTFIENAQTPYDYISIITKNSALDILMFTHNTPNGADASGSGSTHATLVVTEAMLPYSICWFEIVREVPPNDTLQLLGRLTNFSIRRICEETPAEVNVEYPFGGGI